MALVELLTSNVNITINKAVLLNVHGKGLIDVDACKPNKGD